MGRRDERLMKQASRFPVVLALLLVATFLALVASYAARPTVRVDIGDYYDSPFARNFHDREVDAAGAGAAWEWPPERQRLDLPGGRQGEWLVTVYAAEGQPDGVLRGLAMSVNGERLDISHQQARSFAGLIPAHLAAAERMVLKLEPGLREGPEPPAGLAGRVVLAPARTYRWSRGESSLLFPGLGSAPWRVDLEVVAYHPGGQPVHARLFANDTLLATLPDVPDQRCVSLLVPGAAMRSGRLDIKIEAATYEDPRPLGVLVSGVAVAPVDREGGALFSWFPPWETLLSCLVVVGVFAVCLASMTGSVWVAAAGGLGAAGVGAWALAVHRFPTTFMLPGVALLAVWSLLLLLALRPLLRWLFAEPRPPAAKAQEGGVVARLVARPVFVNALLLIFFAGYWLKVGGMLYPYFVAIDVHWHMEKVRHILDGGLSLYYGVDSPLNESTMPLAEWGHTRPVIPYSPYYHMLAAGFVLLPWSLELSASLLSALLDCSHVLLIALLVERSGLSRRVALLAALLYAVLPFNFLLHSWGNVPTTSGLWWAFVATVGLVVGWGRLHRLLPFVTFAVLLFGALLVYTVAGFFMGLFLLIFTLLVALVAFRFRRAGADDALPLLLAGLRPVWLAIVAALALALLMYYGQYIGPIFEQTLPYFGQALTSSSEELGKASDLPLRVYLARHWRLWDYGLLVPFVLAGVWVADGARRIWRFPSGAGGAGFPLVLWAAVAAWMGVTLLFIPLAYKVSMVDKHFFVSAPFAVVASAALIDRFWQRGWGARLATLLFYGYLALAALDLWVMRIITVKQ